MRYLGIDVGKKESSFYVVDDKGKRVGKGVVPSAAAYMAPLVSQLRDTDGLHVALESGNPTFEMARALRASGADVVVIHPRDNALIAQSRKKTDGTDARTLADQRRRHILPVNTVHIPTEICEDARHLLTTRSAMVKSRTQYINRLLAIVGRYEIFPSKRSLTSDPKLQALRHQLAPLRRADELAARQWIRLALQANKEIRRLEREVSSLLRRHFDDAYVRLQTVPGVGPITAAACLAWTSPVERFPTARQFATYAGLTPSTRQSGARRVDGGVKGAGNRLLAGYFVQAAMSFIQNTGPEHELKQWYEHVRRRRGWKKARVALARKIASVCYGVLKHNTSYDPQHLAKSLTAGMTSQN